MKQGYLCLGPLALVLGAGLLRADLAAEAPFPFITRQGDKLMEGDKEFRFASFNHPNLHIDEDPTWHRVAPWEQEDAIKSIAQMGGRVVRIYTLSIKGGRRNGSGLSHVYSPGHYDEDLMRDYDNMIALCRKYRVRLIIPFIDEWEWFGGIDEFSRFRGKTKKEFYGDAQIQADFRALVKMLVTRVNTVTGVAYRDDPTIMAWEGGNELVHDPEAWECELAAYVKSLAPHQLFQDGHPGPRPRTLGDPNVDLLAAHLYGKFDFAEAAHKLRERTKGRKPFYIGEFDPRRTGGLLDEVVANGSAGVLAWSLRGHAKEGGFFCHVDPLYYHWPHSRLTHQIRKAAYAIRGLPEPAVEIPSAPELLPPGSPRALTWRGSAGAEGYRLERAASSDGPWTLVADDISDNRCSGSPLFDDEEAPDLWPIYYRLKAKNASGDSDYSSVMRCGH